MSLVFSSIENFKKMFKSYNKRVLKTLSILSKKAIYDLKHAPKSWYQKLSFNLLVRGFTNTKSNTSIFIKHTPNHVIIILACVDDDIIGIEVNRKVGQLHMSQMKYFNSLISKVGLESSKPNTVCTICTIYILSKYKVKAPQDTLYTKV